MAVLPTANGPRHPKGEEDALAAASQETGQAGLLAVT